MNRDRGQQRAQRLRHQQHVADQAFHRRRNGKELTAARLQYLFTRDPNEVTLSLASSLHALKKLLNQTMDYGLAELFVRVLRKSMQSISLKEKNNQILSLLLHSHFPLTISQMLVEINHSNKGYVEFLQNLMYILKTILIHNPSEYLNTLQIIGVMNVILQDLVESKVDDVGNLLVKYEELQNLLQALTKRKRKQETEKVLSFPEFPPEDFRDLEMMPTAEAIHCKEKIFLRK